MDPGRTVLERVVQWAARTPQSPAVIENGTELGYAELAHRAAEMAQRISRHAAPGATVGVCLPRGTAGVTAMLGVWWAGCAYLPVDPLIPATRRAAVVETAQPAAMVCPAESSLSEAFADQGLPVLAPPVLTGTERPTSPAADVGPPLTSPSGILYVVFTSGSTGAPKGIAMGESAFRRLVQWHAAQGEQPGLRTAHLAAVGFDVALQEVAATLCTGGTLVILDEETRHVPARLLAETCVNRVQRVFLPTAALQLIAEESAYLSDSELPQLTDVVCAGDQLRITPAVRRFFTRMAGCRLHNHYGPAETHVVTAWTAHDDPGSWPDKAPIGTPLPHVDVELAATGDEAPGEQAGELIIHGDRVAQGYVGRPDLTAERFLTRDGRRGYRTGDLVALEGGSLVFCGRVDRQVKIDGFRVELDDVEAHLSQHPEVAECVVDAVPGDSGKDLAGYVVLRATAAGTPPGHREFRAFLSERLPAFMIPLRYRVLARIPLTVNGKLDRRALASPAALPAPPAARSAATAHQDLAALVRHAYAQAIGHDDFRVDENFFDLGGTSLRAARVRTVLEDGLGRNVPIIMLYNHPTVRALAAALESERTGTATEPPEAGRRPAHPARRVPGRSSPAATRAPTRQERAGSATAVHASAVAVIGIGCRMPMAPHMEAFWSNLTAGRDCVRREHDAASGLLRAGGWVEDLEGFDTALFPMSAREAALLDPQHRMFIECCWSALESAGIAHDALDGAVGLFGGVGISSYLVNHVLPTLHGPGEHTFLDDSTDLQVMLAADKDYLTSRVAYRLDLRGPVVTVQAACATGLVAVHLAAQSLLNGECDLALAGAASASVPQLNRHLHEPGLVLSEDGYCRSFDAGATGTVFGSGAAVVVLKRLEDAVGDGDPIVAVVRGSAVGNDGSARAGLTAPSSRGQAAVIARALSVAEVDQADIDYVEGHGTATPVGDPIEVAALNSAFRDVRDRTIGLGSVKTNIGHVGTAAGMAGLVKTLLCLRHGTYVPTLHFDRPHPDAPFADGPFEVVTERVPWPRHPDGRPRRAGVSAFGVGGNNAHVIVEEYPPSPPAALSPPPGGDGRRWHLVPLSAASEAALAGAAAVQAAGTAPLPDVMRTLAGGRVHHGRRVGIVARDRADLERALASVAGGHRRAARAEPDPLVALMFTGHAPGRHPLGELSETAPVQAVLTAADPVMHALVGLSATDVLLHGRGDDQPLTVGQPAQLVLQAALFELWRAWGVRPRLVIGHSLGEFAAAYAAGVMDLADAIRLVAARGRLLDSLPRDGAMSAMEAGVEDISRIVGELDLRLSIAAVNGPRRTVVSGPAADVEAVAARVTAAGGRVKHLGFGRAGHSEAVDTVLEEFAAEVAKVRLDVPRLGFVSNLTGGPVTDGLTDPRHWVRHLRETVQFASGVGYLMRQKPTVLLEVGPAPVLGGMVADGWPDCAAPLLPTLRPGTDPERTMLTSLAALYEAGVDVDWTAVHQGRAGRRIHLPTYAFDRTRHWIDRKQPEAASDPRPAAGVDTATGGVPSYRTGWEPDPSTTQGRLLRGHWLIIPDSGGVASAVAARLGELGHLCTWAAPVTRVGGPVTVDGRALKEFIEAPPLPVSGLLSFHALDVGLDPGRHRRAADALEADAARVVLGALHVLQDVTATATAPLRTWLFTRGAASTANRPVDPLHAMVAAAARCAVHEFPDLSCTRVDLDPVRSAVHGAAPDVETAPDVEGAPDVEAVLDALAREGEADVAYRDGDRLVRRINPAPAPAGDAPQPFAGDGTYLVTGGLGGLGPVTARALLAGGAGHVVLAGRTDDGQGRREGVLREIGAIPGRDENVSFAYADVTDATAVDALIRRLDRPERPLRGVVHAAARISDAALHNQDAAGFHTAWQAKALGAWHLHVALAACSSLEFFTCFTSATGLLGNPGQLNYAAANAFVDTLMEYRCAQRLPGQSLAWGPWAEVGHLLEDSRSLASLRRSGMGALSLADGAHALRTLLGRADGAGGVLANDWSVWRHHVGPAERRSIEHLDTAADRDRPEENRGSAAELVALLHAGQTAQADAWALRQVTDLVAEVLGARAEAQERLRDLGLDSLSAVQLRNALVREFEVPLPVNTCLDLGTPAELAAHLTLLTRAEHALPTTSAPPQEEK